MLAFNEGKSTESKHNNNVNYKVNLCEDYDKDLNSKSLDDIIDKTVF